MEKLEIWGSGKWKIVYEDGIAIITIDSDPTYAEIRLTAIKDKLDISWKTSVK